MENWIDEGVGSLPLGINCWNHEVDQRWMERKKAMEIKMGCSLMILHILDFCLSGELAKAMVEIFSLDK